MSVGKVRAKESDSRMEERIAEYLRLHADFFSRHPDLAARIEIPHACGDAVSLIEYQVSVLRDQNHQLRHRLQDLISHARENEDLSGRLQRLTLALIDCSDLHEIFATLYEGLRETFQADRPAIRLFLPPRAEQHGGLAEFVHGDGRVRERFEQVLAANSPVCGRIKAEQAEVVFGDEGPPVRSGALMPLAVVKPFGILAIGSYDEKRFHAGMGTVFLRQLGEVAAHVIQPYMGAS